MSYVAPYIESDQLVTLLRDKTKVPGKDYVIIDVRDKDFYASIQPPIDSLCLHLNKLTIEFQ